MRRAGERIARWRAGPPRRWLAAVALTALGGICAASWLASAGPTARRSLLYPRGPRVLSFNHRHPAHAGEPCSSCHPAVRRSISANDHHTPREAACRTCHDETRANDRIKRAKAGQDCGSCHVGFNGQGRPAKVVQPVARVRFSHRLHAAKGVACASCHRFNAAPLPPMKRCIACHRRRRATTRCTACHLSDKDGRLVVRFGTARLKPRGSFVRAAHTPLFERGGHKTAARANRRYCQRCHRSSDCLRCHAGSYKPMRIHRSDYVTHHALDARLGRPRCSSCHRSQSFCLSCHVRSGVSQSSGRGGFKPSTGLSFHPPGFNAARKGPGHHGLAARRNITGCVSCHAESTCIRCHGTAQRGMGGFSPHPVGFGRSLKCRVLARRNGRVCRKCHTVTPQCR